MGGTDFDYLSRLDGIRIAAQRTRTGRPRNAEHHRQISARPEKLGVRFRERTSHHDRSQAAFLCRFGEVPRRSAATKIAGVCVALQGMGGTASEIDRSRACEL